MLPFYILHQPVILLVLWLVVIPTDLPVLVKYLLTMAISLPIIIALYAFVVQRVGALRFLFGMKPAKAAPGPRLARAA